MDHMEQSTEVVLALLNQQFTKLEQTMRDGFDSIRDISKDHDHRIQKLEQIASPVSDHETRLRKVERWIYGIPLSTLVLLLALVVEIVRNKT